MFIYKIHKIVILFYCINSVDLCCLNCLKMYVYLRIRYMYMIAF